MTFNNYDLIERDDGVILILNKYTGEKLWRFDEFRNKDNMGWTIENGILIITDNVHIIYAFEL